MDYNFSNISRNDKKVFLMLSPDYANVGDIAISLAQEKILKKAYPDRYFIEIPMLNFYNHIDNIKNIINDDDIITIIGGGNMGSVYLEGEERRRAIIETFPNNTIISFPQSIDFEHTSNGSKEFKKTISIYGKNKNLSIFARENRSYNIMKNNFKNNVYLVPDTVFYLTKQDEFFNPDTRNKITICLRDDAEKSKDSSSTAEMIKLLKHNNFDNINSISTYLEGLKFKPSEKKEIFESILKEFTSSKFVITDRLHGMIFSLITHTPCIAFDNSNKKISSTYNTWLKNCPYVKLIDNSNKDDLLKFINEFAELKQCKFEFDINKNFESLFNILK